MNLIKCERETIIRFDEEYQGATVYTCNRKLQNKLDAICKENTTFVVVRQDEYSKLYEIPKRCISIRKPTIIIDVNRVEMASRARRMVEQRKERQV